MDKQELHKKATFLSENYSAYQLAKLYLLTQEEFDKLWHNRDWDGCDMQTNV